MGPRLRKVALTVHVTASVGWLGAVAAYLALDLTVATRSDLETLRAAYIAMDLMTDRAIVPLAYTALLTGLLMALGTKWGLFRHYWVLVSFALTLLATVVLTLETRTIDHYASVAADPATSDETLRGLGNTLVHSIGGLVTLLVVQVLNLYKPRGMTRYGWRKQQQALDRPMG
jgi:hypothetical protein